VDNLCHTLAGAAFAEAGLKQRTRFGTAALLIAANAPDVDVLAFASSTPAVALRRGWTHGVLAQALLPILLTMAFVAADRWRPPVDGGRRLRPAALLALCYAGVLSHVAMDWLNNYGVRLLMPFSERWFYGDVLFIVDPWLWLVLAAGVFGARRARSAAPAAVALLAAAAYALVMTASAFAAREKVLNAWRSARGGAPAGLMVGPVPVTPFRRTVIIDAGEHYEVGTFEWAPTRVRFDPQHVLRNASHPAARAASLDPDFQAVLRWARFPYYQIEPVQGGTRVTLADLRFPRRLFTATTVVPDP
jgi:inner membrane protein